MSEKIFKVSGEEFRKQYKEAYESGRASLVDKMPAEFFARTAISDEVAVLLFRYMSFLDDNLSLLAGSKKTDRKRKVPAFERV